MWQHTGHMPYTQTSLSQNAEAAQEVEMLFHRIIISI